MKSSFRKDLASNITLICILAFSAVHLVLITLDLFNVTNFNLPANFSYIAAYVLMVLCFGLYILGFFIESIKSLKIPTWFKMTFYILFFVFTNVYYILGLYENIFAMLALIACLTLFLNIVALSIYFNMAKDEKNKLKATTKSLIFNTTTYSIALSALAIFIISVLQILFLRNFALTTLDFFVFEMLTALIVCAIIAVMFAISHKKSKVIINGCLIKITPKTISPSIKK